MRAPDHARVMALAALGADWRAKAIAEALERLFGTSRPWMIELGRSVRRAFPTPPTEDALTAFLRRSPRARGARRLGIHHPPLDGPTMPPSPFGAPALSTVADVGALLEIPMSQLDWLADRRGSTPGASARLSHYRARWVPKRRGGHRLIEAPKDTLRGVQRRLLDRILAHVPPHDAAHGFVPGRGVLDHARAHAGRAVVVTLDLEEFFLSVSGPWVKAIFVAVGYPEEIAEWLTALTTAPSQPAVLRSPHVTTHALRRRLSGRHLPQGAPTSPWLANLAARRLDVRLSALAASVGGSYTRYADDLALSGDAALARRLPRVLPLVGAIAIEEGLALNHRKTRVMREGVSQRVCGLVVNRDAHVPRRDRERLEAILVNCARHGPASQNRDALPDFREHLAGRVAWVAQACPRHGAKLRGLLDRIGWS